MATASVNLRTGSNSIADGTSPISERQAKLRARHQALTATRERLAEIQFPDESTCKAVVHACFELRKQGFRDGEIDDAVGARYGIEGWLVQYIVIWFAEQMVRQIEGAQALQRNAIDGIREAYRNTFSEAPGRPW